MTLCTGKICNFIMKNIIFEKNYTMKYLKNMQFISFDIYFKILNSLYVSYMSLDFVSTSDHCCDPSDISKISHDCWCLYCTFVIVLDCAGFYSFFCY